MSNIPEPSEFWGWGENWYELTEDDYTDLLTALAACEDQTWANALLMDFNYTKNGKRYGRCSRIDEQEMLWLEANGLIFDWVPFLKSQYPVQSG